MSFPTAYSTDEATRTDRTDVIGLRVGTDIGRGVITNAFNDEAGDLAAVVVRLDEPRGPFRWASVSAENIDWGAEC